MTDKLQWNSSMSFILAMIGGAVGLGNIWRFSYVLYSNGGGTFFIPYLCAIAVLGIPFLILEYGIGYNFKKSFSKILKDINERYEYMAWALILLVFLVVCYYMVIISWDLIYIISSFTFSWGADTSSFFTSIAGSSDFSNAGVLIIPTAVCLIALWFVLWYISHKGLNDGIGKVSKILIPALFVIMMGIIIYAVTLPGHMIGIDTLLRPKWNMIWDIDIWIAAFGQILFSLSMGQAISLTYASYLPEDSKITDNVLIVVASNSLFEIFTAFGVFSILGYMSLHSGMAMEKLVSEGTGLVFIVFPMIFNIMGPIARVLAPLFFIAILFAGITSAIAIFEPMLSSVSSKFALSRKKATTILVFIGCLISLLYTTGIGSHLLGVVDGFINSFGVLFLVGLQCIIFTWFYKVDDLIPVLNANGHFKVGKKWKFTVKYVLPVLIFSMWIYGISDLFMRSGTFELIVYSIIIISVLVFSVILTRLKSKN